MTPHVRWAEDAGILYVRMVQAGSVDDAPIWLVLFVVLLALTFVALMVGMAHNPSRR